MLLPNEEYSKYGIGNLLFPNRFFIKKEGSSSQKRLLKKKKGLINIILIFCLVSDNMTGLI